MNKISRGRPDFLMLFLTVLLVAIGLVMVFSSSAMTSSTKYHNMWYFELRQVTWASAGLFFLFFFMNIRYQKLKKWFRPLFLLTVVLLVLVLIVGTRVNGHKSWFGIGSLGMQPTELAKLSLVLYLAALIEKKGDRFRKFKEGLAPVLLIVGFIAGLIMLQPDIGSNIIIVSAAVIMMIVGGASRKHLLLVALCAMPVGLLIVTAKSYRIQRLTSFMDPWSDTQNSSYQLVQSLYAFGHGGLTGSGFGQGIQKLFYLPEAHTDFIFSTIGEEFGFIGCVLFLLIYLAFLWRGLIIALRSPDSFGTLCGVGIVSTIGIQALINLGGVTGSIPITGVPLPFISYGGSSLLLCMVSIGVLLSISRERGYI